jgi:hypothetical protein
MACILPLIGDGFQFFQDNQQILRQRYSDTDATNYLDRAKLYDRASEVKDQIAFLEIGQEIFAWQEIDSDGWVPKFISRFSQIGRDIAASVDPDAAARTLLNIPWEIIAKDSTLLASGELRPSCIQRHLERSRALRPA